MLVFTCSPYSTLCKVSLTFTNLHYCNNKCEKSLWNINCTYIEMNELYILFTGVFMFLWSLALSCKSRSENNSSAQDSVTKRTMETSFKSWQTRRVISGILACIRSFCQNQMRMFWTAIIYFWHMLCMKLYTNKNELFWHMCVYD